jgi:DNA topoisomerase-1
MAGRHCWETMTDRQNERPRISQSALRLTRRLGLRLATVEELTIRRRRCGRGWSYLRADGKPIREPDVIDRLARMAMPPAYADVLYADDPAAHLQAVGRDAAGRLQYRYHPEWDKVREQRKSRRLARLAAALPRIRRSVGQHLASAQPSKAFACAGVIELVSCSAIRPGSESYARERGTRGAATLLKSNVSVDGKTVTLTFRAKGGKNVVKQFACPRFARVFEMLRALPGRRLFQYRDGEGAVRHVSAQDVNRFLREIAGVQISLKDFRTLTASANALERLAQTPPEKSDRKRKRQVLDAIRATADDLLNTPAICRKSYVHQTVVTAFEDGALLRYAETLKGCRSASGRAKVLAEVLAGAA